jgi:two-component system phosphate regulon sensor histidine kinase PhoR
MKSFFVASVSHDLKTPLSSINMYAELLQHKKKKTTRLSEEYLQIIQGESSRLARLIDNVLDLAMIEKGMKKYQFSKVNLGETMKEALLTMDYQFKMNKFRVKTSLGRRNIFIPGDKDSIIEALTNILSNAMKYSLRRREIKVSLHRSGDFAEVAVTDKGEGISTGNLQNIFSPYFRSKESAYVKGTGIGLAIVKHIMEAHGGNVEVESKVGSGSTFRLKFPLKNNEQ